MSWTVLNGAVRERSTKAARDYVKAVRARLRDERARHGDEALTLRSYQELQRRISPEELGRTWPHARPRAGAARMTRNQLPHPITGLPGSGRLRRGPDRFAVAPHRPALLAAKGWTDEPHPAFPHCPVLT